MGCFVNTTRLDKLKKTLVQLLKSEIGEQQAREAGEKLKDIEFDLIVVSPLRRTCATARLVLEHCLDKVNLQRDQQHFAATHSVLFQLTPIVIPNAAEDVTAADDFGIG